MPECRNAGEKLVRHRNFFRYSAASVRHRYSGIRVQSGTAGHGIIPALPSSALNPYFIPLPILEYTDLRPIRPTPPPPPASPFSLPPAPLFHRTSALLVRLLILESTLFLPLPPFSLPGGGGGGGENRMQPVVSRVLS
jgi:hypothetical protein